jgi:hypothetical protein
MLLPPCARRGRPPETERPHPHRGNPIVHHVAGACSGHRDTAGRPRAVTPSPIPAVASDANNLTAGLRCLTLRRPRRRQDRSSSPRSGRFVLTPPQSAVSSHQTKEQPNKHIPYRPGIPPQIRSVQANDQTDPWTPSRPWRPDLDVGLGEVGAAGDGRTTTECAVGPVVVIPVQPGRERGPAGVFAGI